MQKSVVAGLSQLAWCFLFTGVLSAQSITGDLIVNVTDPSGGIISNAKLVLTQVETNVRFEGATDSLGNFLYSNLKPGRYVLDVTAAGFQKANITGISISLGQRARVDAKLEVGQISQEVSVSATAETLLNAESASVGQVLNSQAITELPLNGRDFIQLAQISAGAAPIGIGVSPATSWTGRGDSTLSIDGGRETNNSFLVNGIETRNSRFGNAGIRPSADAVEGFRVQRSTFGAEFGRSSAIINTTIKSGTNDLHLAVFGFIRNRNLDANDFFANRTGRPKPAFTQNNFGTAVGGQVDAIIHDGTPGTAVVFDGDLSEATRRQRHCHHLSAPEIVALLRAASDAYSDVRFVVFGVAVQQIHVSDRLSDALACKLPEISATLVNEVIAESRDPAPPALR